MAEGQVTTTQAKLWLLYMKLQNRIQLSLNILREICTYIRPHFYPLIWDNTLKVYNLCTQCFSPQRKFADFIEASYVTVDENCVICLGKYPASREIYSLNLTSLHLTALPPLDRPRYMPGVNLGPGQFAGTVYIFGGRNEKYNLLASCVKYGLKEQKPRKAGTMKSARCGFTPCTYKLLIYLVCTTLKDLRTVEVFDPGTDTCTEMPVSLPPHFDLDCPSVSFVAKGCLILFTWSRQAAYWEIDLESEFRVRTTDRSCHSAQIPLVLDSLVLIANYAYSPDLRVERFSLQSYSFL